MKSRMEKYSNNFLSENRTERNRDLYREVNKADISVTRTYSNSRVIDEANKEIDIEKIKRYVEKMNDEGSVVRKRIDDIEISHEEDKPSFEEKDYDINSVLEKARSKREDIDYESARSRRVNHSVDDIIKKIEKYNKELKKTEEDEEELNTEEQTLVDLINTISMNKKEADLFEDLKGSENTQVLGNINDMASDASFKDEIKKQINTTSDLEFSYDKTLDSVTREMRPEPKEESEAPKVEQLEKTSDSFYTTSNIFNKRDFETENDGDDDFSGKSSPLKTIGIIMAILVLIGVLVVVANYVFELGLF